MPVTKPKRFHVDVRRGGSWVHYQPRWAKRNDYVWAMATAIYLDRVRVLGKRQVRRRLVTATPVSYPNATHVTPRYTWSEVASKDGINVPPALRPGMVRLCRAMEQVSDHMGRKVYARSWYRSPAENRRVNGATSSQHMSARACDPIFAPGERMRLLAIGKSIPEINGIGIYPNGGLHFDVRPGPRAFWSSWGGYR